MAAIKSVGASQTGEKVLATFPVPYKGVRRDHSEIEIPKDALWVGENLHFFQGELRQRPSWNLARNTTIAAPPTTWPITGIYSTRRATTRDHPPIVVEGELVEPGDKLAVVEAMNIPSDVVTFTGGHIKKILVENGQSVEYGQPLFTIEPIEVAADHPEALEG